MHSLRCSQIFTLKSDRINRKEMEGPQQLQEAITVKRQKKT